MKRFIYILTILAITANSCKKHKKGNLTDDEQNKIANIHTNDSDIRNELGLKISAISHATMVIEHGVNTIYIDPTGGKDAFKIHNKPTIILITDIHGDHYNYETLNELDLNGTIVVAPQAVVEKFPENFVPIHKVLKNGESTIIKDISIEAIPMYNLREEALKFHPKGRGNGYVLTLNDKRIYISGDTEDIPEMRSLKNIDVAFVCMNLPYTMTVESAADAILEFKPKQVYPYHYRGTEGFSDVEKFKSLVNNGNPEIEVIQLDWYKNQ